MTRRFKRLRLAVVAPDRLRDGSLAPDPREGPDAVAKPIVVYVVDQPTGPLDITLRCYLDLMRGTIVF